MTVAAWRIIKRKHLRSAFTGEGAKLFGGRWTSPGTPVIYAAQSQSLAALEILVHLDSTELLEKYVLIEITTEEALILRLEHGKLPRNWNKNPSPASLKAIGDSWAREGSSVALRVSSALVPGEDNFLFNPAHSDFQKVRIGKPLTFRFDPRLTSKP